MKPFNSGETHLAGQLEQARRNSADVAELVGLCKGILADGTINLAEAEFILDWLDDRADRLDIWPARELHQLIVRVLEDSVLNAEEEAELIALLEDMTGERVTLLIY
ncbi:hypothetical protein [Parahaliea mediterranea]|uniref:Uncharacterized protein n=1 Tax=Parahaliea mediterranea TaxID=651086 RepID=A0A939IN79_9GAMM|nr:hypothetical protein [Parahaliea mediterranea]MBN7797823.1 hypothetical protein [Parahaliea mediterranea]